VERTVEALGGLDILVSNAGVEHFGSLSSITSSDYERVFTTNVAGQLFATQAAAAAMDEGGRILLTSSVSARIAVLEHSLYAASKAAVSALVLNLAPELATRGIAINAIAAGGTRTEMAGEYGHQYTPPVLRDLPPEKLTALFNAWGRRRADGNRIRRRASCLSRCVVHHRIDGGRRRMPTVTAGASAARSTHSTPVSTVGGAPTHQLHLLSAC
jgi:NAD(P)-dependent dehydrogenase (short-subunit alcohol dehydrogenase family)